MITRINEFHAAPGQGDALLAALRGIVPTILAAPGCRSCELLQGLDEPARVAIVEVWDSVESHKAALKATTHGMFEPVSKLLDRSPTGAYFKGAPA
jgi:quinol monooxygenase YgiN